MLFQKKAIQKLIDFNFKVVKKYTIQKLFIPFGVFLVLFVFYLNFVYEKRFSHDLEEANFWYPIDLTLMGILGAFAFYFLLNEIK